MISFVIPRRGSVEEPADPVHLGNITSLFVTLDTANSCLACHYRPMEATHDFDALTRQHKDVVYRQLIRVCGNREDAEDVLVEALLKAFRHLNQLRDSAAFRAWLTQIAKRVCWQLKEREALLPLLQLSELEEEGREIPGAGPTPELILARRQMKQFLDEAIASLPEEYKAIYKLRDIDGRRGDEVAKQLGMSRAAMKSRLHRARAMVREHLDASLTGNVREEETREHRKLQAAKRR